MNKMTRDLKKKANTRGIDSNFPNRVITADFSLTALNRGTW